MHHQPVSRAPASSLDTAKLTMTTRDVPRWESVKLGDVYSFTEKPRGLRYADYDGIPFVPMELIPVGQIYSDRHVLKSPAELTTGTYFEPGDLLVAKITPSFENGKQTIIRRLPTPFGIATTEVIPLRGIPHVSDTEYLYYYLLWSDIRSYLAGKMEGTTGRQRLGKAALADLEMLVPPLPEQHAIARTLRAVQAACEARRREIALEGERKAALVDYLFTHGTRGEPRKQTEIGEIPESWQVVQLGAVSTVTSGGTPDRGKCEYWNGQIPWVKTSEINYNVIRQTEEQISEQGLKYSSAKVVPAGTLLMAMYGQGVTRGRVAILRIDAAINQACAAISLSKTMSTLFVFYFFTYSYDRIRNLGHGANQKNLNSVLIKSILLPCPLPLEQQEIVDVLSACDAKIAAVEREVTLLDELFRAMLEELMTGRLSAMAPTEERGDDNSALAAQDKAVQVGLPALMEHHSG